MTDKKSIHFVKLSFIYSFIIAAFFNHTIFTNIFEYFASTIGLSIFEIFFLVLTFLVLWFLLAILFLLIGTRYILKPLIAFLLLASSIIFYYRQNYGVAVDEGIILSGFDSIKERNFHEIYDLLGINLIPIVLLMGIIPSVPLLFFQIIYPNFIKEFLIRFFLILIMIVILVSLISINYKSTSITARTLKSLNQQSIPHYFIGSIFNIIKNSLKKNNVFVSLDEKPTTNLEEEIIGIVVVGETARASHFSLNGYEKKTNPLLEKQNIINFFNAKACGTLTKISVPCMFYLGDYHDFSEKKARFQTNALDIISNAGVEVSWIENNSSCKNVCERINSKVLNPENIHTYDELLLEETVNFINNLKTKKGLIVLHAIGSHGPKYYKRYPKQFEKFTPSCKINTPQDCTKDELINSYDNTILYTDYILNSLIEILKKENLNSFLIYASDHGESLGEKGLYLHGVPIKFAPKEQTHIPFFLWYSDSYKNKYKPKFADPNKEITHEYFPHTILESLRVKSKTIKKERSLVKLN